MAVQPPNLTLFEDKTLLFTSAVFLSMTIDPASRRRSHKFTSQDLIPALKPLEPPQVVVQAQVRARIPTTDDGEMFLYLYRNTFDTKEHLAIVYGNDIRSLSLDASRPGETDTDRVLRGAYVGRLSPGTLPSTTIPYLPQPAEAPLVRIHSECFTGESVHSARCDCGEQLDEAMRLMKEIGHGVVVYLRQEGRGIGLLEKLKAYNLQDLGHDTVAANLLLRHPADARKYDVATAILRDLGLTEIKLLTNNPNKIEQVEGDGVKVVERIPMVPKKWEGGKVEGGERELDKYLRTKVERMRHIIDLPASSN